jgi:GNAT superfamily N-acetyltransferase
MAAIGVDDLKRDPDLATRELVAGDGTAFRGRLLHHDDTEALGRFFDGLSQAVRGVYGPHSLNAEHAGVLCAELDYGHLLPFVAQVEAELQAYFLVQVGVRDGDRKRYEEHGPVLVDDDTVTFAPCVADAFQERGLGSALMPHVLDTVRRLGRSHMVLWGGVRGDNPRAQHFYRKFGFRHVGNFAGGGVDNLDMILDL